MIQFKGVISPIKSFVDGGFRISFDVSNDQIEQVAEIMKQLHTNVIVNVFTESEALKLASQTDSQLRQTIYKKIMNAGMQERRRDLYQVMFGKEHLKDMTLEELQELDSWCGDSKNYLPLREKILEVLK
jgi:hypothetical protein